jgi:hypothetical protein
MPDLRTALRDAGGPVPPPAVDLAALHARAQRLRRRRTVAATVAVVVIATGTAFAGEWFIGRLDHRVDLVAPQPSPSPAESGAESTSPSPDTGAEETPYGPVTVASSDDARWRLMVGRQHGGLCAQLVRSDEDFDQTFCGAYAAEVDAVGVAAAFAGSEGSPDAFSYGMVARAAAAVRLELDDGRAITHDTIVSRQFPDVRFFLVQLPLAFSGVETVTALDRNGKHVGQVDLRGQDDI